MAKTVPCSPAGLRAARDSVKRGGVIAFPTDTVYGLGCDPYDGAALDRIYRIKERPRSKGLPVLGLRGDIEKIASVEGAASRIAAKFWPGRVTLVVPLRDRRLARALGSETVAVREPSGACVRALLEGCGPLVGTSANRSGMPAPRSAPECSIEGHDILVDGGPAGGTPSTIADCVRGVLARRGESAEEVERML